MTDTQRERLLELAAWHKTELRICRDKVDTVKFKERGKWIALSGFHFEAARLLGEVAGEH